MDLSTMYYLAGYFDGEGCFRWHTGTVGASVSNTYPGILEMLRATWGGSVRKRKPRPGARPCFEWEISGQNARVFAQDIAPYLREKRKQAYLVSTIMSFPPHSAQREEGIAQLKQLKRQEHTL